MLSLIFLAAVGVSAASTIPVCAQPPHKQLQILASYPPALSFCSSKYPLPVVTSISTTRAVTSTKVVATSTTTLFVDTTIQVIPSTDVTTTTSVDVDEETITEATAITVGYTSPALAERGAPKTFAAPWASLLQQGPNIIKTACSCIQTPSTKVVPYTPTSTTRVTSIVVSSATSTSLTTSVTTEVSTEMTTVVVTTTTTAVETAFCPSASPSYCPSRASCVDTSSDRNNCGACGNACGDGSTCISGQCLGIACSAPETCDTGFTQGACGAASGCNGFCVPDINGNGVCRSVSSSAQCGTLQQCTPQADCSSDNVCSLAGCCGFYACRSVSGGAFCQNAAAPTRMFRGKKRQALSLRQVDGHFKTEFPESRIIGVSS